MRWIALVVALAAVAVAAAANAAARRRHRFGDTGYLWATATAVAGVLAALDAVSAFSETPFPTWWMAGRHLEFDRSRAALGVPWAFPAMAVLPVAVWALAVALICSRAPRHDHAARWLAGSISAPGARTWVLCGGALSLLALMFGFVQLDTGANGVSVATWEIAALWVISLVGLAMSAGTIPTVRAEPAVDAGPAARPPLPPWPEGMRDSGIALETLRGWERGAQPRHVRGTDAEALGERLADAPGVAPELIEVASRLIAFDLAGERTALVLAPDDCGQVEVTSQLASELFLTANETTLIITSREDPGFARRIEGAIPDRRDGDVQVMRAGADVPAERAIVWVVDAQTLSDRFLERLTEPRVAGRVGLVVWWDVHEFTGVLAANVWAISRRFKRLMAAHGRPGLRTLVLVRDAPHGAAQLEPFVHRLLGYTRFGEGMNVRIEQGFARAVSLHRLRGHADRFGRRQRQNLPEKSRYPALIAAQASAELQWVTHLQPPADVTDAEVNAVLEQSVDQRTRVRDSLVPSAAEAAARIRHLSDGDVLALPAIVSQGGRMAPPHLPHHVAITTSDNPYVAYLLGQIGERGLAAFGSRRFVAAEGHTSIVERHLLAALRELPDVGSNLVQTFLWKESVIEKKLEALDAAGSLNREEVRFLDPHGDRMLDYFYRSRHPRDRTSHPLDTVGVDLVDVRDPAGSDDEKGVRLRVDPERVTVMAYPGRVFVRNGRRYRIREWTDQDLKRGWVACELDERPASTWRIRHANVSKMTVKAGKAPVVIETANDVSVSRIIVDLSYEENVSGSVRVETDLTTGERRRDTPFFVPPKISEPFMTAGLILSFDPPPSAGALSALALALAYVLPVHLGVEDNALEVVPLYGRHLGRAMDDEPVRGRARVNSSIYGLAIVDLYPDGIGLVDAIEEDLQMIRRILELTRDWFVVEANNRSGQALTTSPLAVATNAEPDLPAAIELLGQLIGVRAVAGTGRRPNEVTLW